MLINFKEIFELNAVFIEEYNAVSKMINYLKISRISQALSRNTTLIIISRVEF